MSIAPAPSSALSTPAPSHAFAAAEWRASVGLALLYMLRMFGLFLLLPIFVLEVHGYVGGDQAWLVGLSLGVYGLVQACLQIPLGWASDVYGRKRVIALGLVVFALGSVMAANADSMYGLLAGRVLQGAGAVGAAMTALLADLTRDHVRTKAMAIVGSSIALSFALSLVLAPWLASHWHLAGIFWIMALAAIGGLVVLYTAIPAEPGRARQGANPTNTPRMSAAHLQSCIRPLWQLHMGVFCLHAIQTQFWLLLPRLLVQAGLVKTDHWQLYLLSLAAALVIMGGGLLRLERKGHGRLANLIAIALLAMAVIGIGLISNQPHESSLSFHLIVAFGVALTLFFTGFNMLEATQPSQVSKNVTTQQRGLAMGVYNTAQSLGLFSGAALGGWLLNWGGAQALLGFSLGLCVLWWLVAWFKPLVSVKLS